MTAQETPRGGARSESAHTVEDLEELRRTLQEAGLAMLEAATTAVTAAAQDTLGASAFVVSSAQRALAAAEEQLRRLRAHLEARSAELGRTAPPGQEAEEAPYGVGSPG